jgi:hypothetical protein
VFIATERSNMHNFFHFFLLRSHTLVPYAIVPFNKRMANARNYMTEYKFIYLRNNLSIREETHSWTLSETQFT